jgi:ribonuclease BN (tRNA processing enzyme)
MRITVVGSGTVVPSLQRRQSCVVVRVGGETLVFDLGSGAVRGMLQAEIDPFAVDRIFFTHFHPDHTVDAVPLLFAINHGSREQRKRPLRVSGPEPFVEFWASLMKVWGQWMAGDYATLLSELPRECPSPIELAGCHLSWAPAEHRHESIAYRLDAESGAFVYTGDTEYSEAVVELARDADTLLIECAFPDDNPMPGHLTPSGVAGMASEAGVKCVVLTHIYPMTDLLDLVSEIGNGFDGEVVVAEDGLTMDI